MLINDPASSFLTGNFVSSVMQMAAGMVVPFMRSYRYNLKKVTGMSVETMFCNAVDHDR